MLIALVSVFFFKQKTAYELRISDWSSDVCSSDLTSVHIHPDAGEIGRLCVPAIGMVASLDGFAEAVAEVAPTPDWRPRRRGAQAALTAAVLPPAAGPQDLNAAARHVHATLPPNAKGTATSRERGRQLG